MTKATPMATSGTLAKSNPVVELDRLISAAPNA
jgi:hypothetical protein